MMIITSTSLSCQTSIIVFIVITIIIVTNITIKSQVGTITSQVSSSGGGSGGGGSRRRQQQHQQQQQQPLATLAEAKVCLIPCLKQCARLTCMRTSLVLRPRQ
jgi:hypothetical protein